MGLKFEEKDSHLIISIDGKLDSLNARQVQKQIEEKLEENEFDVIFNLEKLEYMTSAGLQVILMVSKNRKAKDKATYLYRPQKIVDYVIKISGFYAFLKKIEKLP